MSRRRFVYREVAPGKVESFEVGGDWVPTGLGNHRSEEEVYGKLQAIDGTDLSTKKRHHDYMKANGWTLAEDYRETWANAEQRRARVRSGELNTKQRRESIERALHQVMNKRRP